MKGHSLFTKLSFLSLAVVLLACSGCGSDHTAQLQAAASTLRDGVLAWNADHNDEYPAARLVCPGQSTSTYEEQPVGMYVTWPSNPFGGAPMHSGTAPGDFQYTELGVFANGGIPPYALKQPFACAGYRLVVYADKGRPALVLGQDTWPDALSCERDSLRSLIDAWLKAHHGVAPPSALVSPAGLGRLYAGRVVDFWPGVWPLSPFTAQPMQAGEGPGDYRYERKPGGGYRLQVFDAQGRPVY